MNSSNIEDEQSEAVKKWIIRHGPSFLLSIFFGLAIVFAYKQWEQFRSNKLADEALRFKAILEYATVDFSKQVEDTEKKFTNLAMEVGALRSADDESYYSGLAACVLAAQAVERGDLDLAVSQLIYAESVFSEKVLSSFVQIQLAQLEIGLGEPKKALKRLENIDEVSLVGTVNLMRGDAFAALGEFQMAKDAYEISNKRADEAGVGNRVVNLKISDLPIDGAD